MNTQTANPKSIVFKGTRYYLRGRYYFNCSRQREFSNLHRAIYAHHHGEIKDGCHVHHKDGDTFNNNIDNLEQMDGREHNSLHSLESEWVQGGGSTRVLEENRHKQLEWARSEEGRAQARRNMKDWQAHRPVVDITCHSCGEVFPAKNLHNAKYCSSKCKDRGRRGYHGMREKPCRLCGDMFVGNGHSKYCSKICGSRFRKSGMRFANKR